MQNSQTFTQNLRENLLGLLIVASMFAFLALAAIVNQ